MDYLKTVVPSQLLAERGSNLVVINPGSANVRIGLAQQDAPVSVPHCISRRTSQVPKKNVQDQMLNSQVTTVQHMERERAYDIIASLLKIRFLDEEVTNNQYSQKMGRVDAFPPQSNSKKETIIPWAEVWEKQSASPSEQGSSQRSDEASIQKEDNVNEETNSTEPKYKEYICGEEALRVSPSEPYCLRRPIRRGHLNISLHYPMQQVIEDIHAIWDWILIEKLHIPHSERHMYSAVLVVPETFDSREIKDLLSIVLRDLRFSTAVVHQEGTCCSFGNGLSTACVVNIGAQVTSVICVEDGVALPTTQINLRYGGEKVLGIPPLYEQLHEKYPSRYDLEVRTKPELCLQFFRIYQDVFFGLRDITRHGLPIRTDALAKPIDLLLLNRLKESHCQIRGELEAVAVVHSYEDGLPPGSHKTRLTALNVPPMGLFTQCSWFQMFILHHPEIGSYGFSDSEDMLEETWDFPRRPDISDGYYAGSSGFYPMWENYPVFQSKPKKQDTIGLADAITKSILSMELQRKLFCSMQLIGGVALTEGLISAVEERVLHAIPSHEAIDTVEVLQSRTNPASVSWKGGAVLGILDFTRDAWIHHEDWIKNGIHIGSGRKYKDSYFLQAQTMCYMNS